MLLNRYPGYHAKIYYILNFVMILMKLFSNKRKKNQTIILIKEILYLILIIQNVYININFLL